MPEYINVKTILSRLKDAPDPYFGITYNMNLYRGCQHQCIYCDSRSKVYQLGDLANIRIKKNALSLLQHELRSKRTRGTIGTGSMNDPYMPLERKQKLTRNALKLIAQYHFPVHVITKSDLVIRDLDILKDIARVYLAVSFTITTPSNKLSKIIEPGASDSLKRFKALEKLSSKGIYAGIIMTPILPFISDKPDDIHEMVKKAKDAGAKYILTWMGMTQREGQRAYYYNKLDEHFPGLRIKYVKEFGNDYSCYSPQAEKNYSIFFDACEKAGMPVAMDFYTPLSHQQLDLF